MDTTNYHSYHAMQPHTSNNNNSNNMEAMHRTLNKPINNYNNGYVQLSPSSSSLSSSTSSLSSLSSSLASPSTFTNGLVKPRVTPLLPSYTATTTTLSSTAPIIATPTTIKIEQDQTNTVYNSMRSSHKPAHANSMSTLSSSSSSSPSASQHKRKKSKTSSSSHSGSKILKLDSHKSHKYPFSTANQSGTNASNSHGYSLCCVCSNPTQQLPKPGVANTCDSCRTFFKRYSSSKKFSKLTQCTQKCASKVSPENLCSTCRYEACLKCGMKSSHVSTPIKQELQTPPQCEENADMYDKKAYLLRQISKEMQARKSQIRQASSEAQIKEHLHQLTKTVLACLGNAPSNANLDVEMSIKRPLLVAYAYLIENELETPADPTSSSLMNHSLALPNEHAANSPLFVHSSHEYLTPYEKMITAQFDKIYKPLYIHKKEPYNFNSQYFDSIYSSNANASSSSGYLYPNPTEDEENRVAELKMLHFLLILFSSCLNIDEYDDAPLIPSLIGSLPNSDTNLLSHIECNEIFDECFDEFSLVVVQDFSRPHVASNSSGGVENNEAVSSSTSSNSANTTAINNNSNPRMVNAYLDNSSKTVSRRSAKKFAADAFESQKLILKLIDITCSDKLVKTKILLSLSDLDLF